MVLLGRRAQRVIAQITATADNFAMNCCWYPRSLISKRA